MESKYQEYKDLYFPEEKIIDWITNVYGEENRELISSKIKNIKVVFVPINVAAQEILLTCEKLYKDDPNVNHRFEAVDCIRNLENLSKSKESVNLEMLRKHLKVLKELGFNTNRILKKHIITGQLKLGKSEEVDKLINYSKYSLNEKNVNTDIIDVQSFVDTYNACAKNKKYCGAKFNQVNETYKVAAHDVFSGYTYEEYSWCKGEIPTIKELDEQDKEFLQDIIQAKGPITKWSESFSNYFVKGINKIFNKNFSTITDFRKDLSFSLLQEMMKDCSKQHEVFMYQNNMNENDFIASKEDHEKYNDNIAQYLQSPKLGGTYDFNDQRLMIPIGKSTDMQSILHEVNHGIGDNGAESLQFLYESRGLEEIINEYLTIQTKKNISQEELERFNLMISKSNYTTGVKLMEKFLSKFESKIKQYRLHGCVSNLKDFIGENNYKKLNELCKFIEDNTFAVGYKGVLVEDATKCPTDLLEWIEAYKKNPKEIVSLTSDLWYKQLSKFLEVDDFVNKMVEHYDDFEKGNIVDIKTEKFSLAEQASSVNL